MNVVVLMLKNFSVISTISKCVYARAVGNLFNAACLLLDNTENSKVNDLTARKTLLYMLVCHIATLQQRGTGMVGLLTSATEGKVSVGLQAYTSNPNWYSQTQCGSMFWLATAKYRVGMRYIGWTPC